MSLATRIREERESIGLKQDDVARACDVSRVSVAYWESGRNEPRASQLIPLARILRVRVDWLLTGAGQKADADAPVDIDALTFVVNAIETYIDKFRKSRPDAPEYAEIVVAFYRHVARHPKDEWPVRVDTLLQFSDRI